jgi:hypothetical protein
MNIYFMIHNVRLIMKTSYINSNQVAQALIDYGFLNTNSK